MSDVEPTSPGGREESDAPAGAAEQPAERPAPVRWDPAEAFRETFLCNFPRRGDVAALHRLGEFLYEAALEVDYKSRARVLLHGALADLRYLKACCESLVRYDREMRLSPREHRLCLFAGELAAALGELAESLAQKLAERSSRRSWRS